MNIYKKLEDSLVFRHYNKIKDGDYICFALESKMGRSSILSIRISIRIMMISFLFTVGFLEVLYLVAAVFTTWVFIVAWFFKNGIETKMSRGYPYFEHTDAIGMGMMMILSFIVAVLIAISVN